MPDHVVVGEFQNELEAGIARTALEANGIDAEVLAQNAFDPGFGGRGLLPSIRLVVRAEDAARARAVLDASS